MFAWLFRYFGYFHYTIINERFNLALSNIEMICFNCKEKTNYIITSSSIYTGNVQCHCPLCNRGLILNVFEKKK